MLNYIFSFILGGFLSSVIVINQDRFGSLQKLYSTVYKNLEYKNKEEQNNKEIVSFKIPLEFLAFVEMTKLFIKLFITKVEQYLRQNCIPTGKYYVLTHIIEGKLYKIIIKPKKGPLEDYDPYQLGFDSVACPFDDNVKDILTS